MSKKKKYFIKQKLAGLLAILTSIGSIFIDGECTFALFMIPFGLWLIFSKKMIFTSDYFFKVEDKNRKS